MSLDVNQKEFKDRRGRTWEMFADVSYYDMICVRWKDDKSFNSPTSFHFESVEDANKFVNLIRVSS